MSSRLSRALPDIWTKRNSVRIGPEVSVRQDQQFQNLLCSSKQSTPVKMRVGEMASQPRVLGYWVFALLMYKQAELEWSILCAIPVEN